MNPKLCLLPSCLVLGLCVLGCVPSLSQRKAEQRAAYSLMEPAIREKIDRGEISEGMSTNAVYIAWGNPSRAKSASTDEGTFTVWEFWRRWTRQHPHWSIEPGPGGYNVTAEYRPTTSSWNYLAGRVVFHEGLVIRWSQFPPPSY